MYHILHVGNPNIYENLGENSKKSGRFFGKLENFLNKKICAAPLAAVPHRCICIELLPLFLFYLAEPHRAALVYNGLHIGKTYTAVINKRLITYLENNYYQANFPSHISFVQI